MRDEAVASLMFELYIFDENKGVCYRKSPFDPGIQVWLVIVEEYLATKISGASYLSFPNRTFSLAVMVETYLAQLAQQTFRRRLLSAGIEGTKIARTKGPRRY